jgi:hypothetical protein
MCLSPQADLVAGAVIAVVAVDALRHNRAGRTLPLALLPAVFAVHSFTEAFVWWGADGTVPAAVGQAAVAFYMVVAFVVLPVYVPACVLLLEPRGGRRALLTALTIAGAIAGAMFLAGMLAGRAQATVCSLYVDYTVTGTAAIAGILYVIATCGAMLLSGERPLLVWGAVNVVAVGALNVWAGQGLPSLWCLWAACTSFFVAWYLRHLDTRHARGDPWPWQSAAPPVRAATIPPLDRYGP